MGNIKDLKKQNLLEVISIIRKGGTMSKQEVAREMKLSNVSAHSFINELVEKEMLLSFGTDNGNRGRRASLYSLNPNYGFVVGQSLSTGVVTTATYDFASSKISTFSMDISRLSWDELCSNIVQQAIFAIESHQKSYNHCLGLGFAVPGLVDTSAGIIRKLIHFPGFNHLHLRESIEQAVGVPVFMDNDNKFSVLAIKWIEDKHTSSPVVFVGIREGVGSGVMINGNVLHGKHSAAGEIGHIPIDIDGEWCSCGGRGCLETRISEKILIEKIVKHLNAKQPDSLCYEAGQFTIGHVITLARDDEFVQNELRTACDYLTICLENIVKIYDPEEIIIDSEYLRALPEYFDYLCKRFYSSQWSNREGFVLRLNTIDDIYATGAAMSVFDNIYSPTSNNLLLDKFESCDI